MQSGQNRCLYVNVNFTKVSDDTDNKILTFAGSRSLLSCESGHSTGDKNRVAVQEEYFVRQNREPFRDGTAARMNQSFSE